MWPLSASTRWPCHLPLGHQVHVDVINRLLAQLIAIHHHAKALGAALLLGQALGSEKDVAGQCGVCCVKVEQGADVFFRDDQNVQRRLRRDIVEGQHLIIFIKLHADRSPATILQNRQSMDSLRLAQRRAEFSEQGVRVKNDIHDLGLVLDSKSKLLLIESWD